MKITVTQLEKSIEYVNSKIKNTELNLDTEIFNLEYIEETGRLINIKMSLEYLLGILTKEEDVKLDEI